MYEIFEEFGRFLFNQIMFYCQKFYTPSKLYTDMKCITGKTLRGSEYS